MMKDRRVIMLSNTTYADVFLAALYRKDPHNRYYDKYEIGKSLLFKDSTTDEVVQYLLDSGLIKYPGEPTTRTTQIVITGRGRRSVEKSYFDLAC
jgi:DNA-binding MarR family transcriptional regulator